MNSYIEELIDIHLNNGLFISNMIKKERYNIYYSNIIDDEYWNFAQLTDNKADLKTVCEDIKIDMEKINRKPLIYITSNILNTNLEENINKMQSLYTDVWMMIDNLEEFNSYKSNIDFSINKVDKNLEEKFINAVMNTFTGDNPEDPYENLSDGYKIALRESFQNNDSEYKVIHYLGINEQEIISTATVVYKQDKAIIYNVTTNKKYQRQGVCKQTMSEIITDLRKIGIKIVCLQTEQGFYTEQVYKNMGFKEIILGKAYQIENK